MKGFDEMPKLKELTGQKFGRLTVIERADKKNKNRNTACFFRKITHPIPVFPVSTFLYD